MGSIVGFFARSALMQSPIGAVLKGFWALLGKVPWQVFAGIFAAIALFVGVRWHRHEIHKIYVSGYAAREAEDAAVLKQLRDQVARLTETGKSISQDTRSKNDAQDADIRHTADAVRLRGPGAASCRQLDHPAVSAAGGRPGATSDQLPNVAGNSLPAADGQPDLAAVPFDWLVGRAEQADLDRAEVLSWRDWYQRQAKAWGALKGVRP